MLLEDCAKANGISRTHLLALARSASHRYKMYSIPKRAGGRREIHHPARQLKAVQRWLLHEVIAHWPVHPAAFAYRKGVGIARHGEVHRGAKYTLRLDFQDFFPSITVSDYRSFVASSSDLFSKWTPEDHVFFDSIVFRFGRLTIGAPTSPALSNALCMQMDMELFNLSGELGCRYSRYADDLFFSCGVPGVLSLAEERIKRVIAGLAVPAGLRVNEEKTRHRSRKGKQVVTGVVLTSQGGLSVGRDLKRVLRAQVHQLPSLSNEERSKLAGMLAYVHSVEPDFVSRLRSRYGDSTVDAACSGR